MPPKPAAGKGKPKSGKLSKAEKEKIKKEEAERKAKEEEEARLLEEQEKREREEKERLEQEERERLWEEEKARHQVELDEVQELLDNIEQQLTNLEVQQREKAKWDRYMLCDGSPDPLVEPELNTFLHLAKDESNQKPVKEVLQECEDILKLISELEKYISDAIKDDVSDEELQQHKKSVTKLQELLNFVLDRATMHLLQNASEHIDPESQNLQFKCQSEHEILCMWGNIVKNPRLKCVKFDSHDFSVEIPKALAVGEISMRLLLTYYDHLSPLAKSYLPKVVKLPEVVVEGPQESEENQDQEEEEEAGKERETEESIRDVATPKSASRISRASKASRRKSGRTGSSKSNKSRKTSAKSARSQASESESQKEVNKEAETEEGAADETKAEGEEAKAVDATPLTEYIDDDEDDDDVVDLRAFGVVGPIMNLELFELPPQPKHVKNWVMQQIVPPNLVRVPYQTENETLPVHSATGSAPGTPGSASATNLPAANPPLAIKFQLPETVVYFEQPQIAHWEPVKKHWRIDGIDDIQYNEEERTVSFKIADFGPIATVQDLYLNMPFQSWEIRPCKQNSCLFTLIAAIIELEIEIKDALCCVTQPEDLAQIDHFKGKWMTPQELIKTLQRAGINVFPAVDAEKYVSINKKDSALETTIYKEMALLASSVGFSWSKWNADSGEDKIVLQAAEQLEDDVILEEDWSLYLVTTRSSCKLKLKEEDSEFSETNADNTQLHSNLYHMIRDDTTPEALQRIKESNFLFVDCVYQLLSATKIITYS
ncbi:dynein axonemal intermediate chain 7 isoform X2 [Nematostella vectensis]|uniref:dynein axonemal intermediate chain 7 isoform X2 n=1 Tax=Nematostella vectensis TaxID=45351 RepID=UPI002076EFAA|nr:dynein axonemal intermediate chain 7 isoform X2 [Nematostella vectensis]